MPESLKTGVLISKMLATGGLYSHTSSGADGDLLFKDDSIEHFLGSILVKVGEVDQGGHGASKADGGV